MKVIIHHQENIGNTVHFTVSSLASIKAMIETFPHEDIEGEIRPSAKNNPELNDILLAIYDHKKALWKEQYPNFPLQHNTFLDILNKNGLILKRESTMEVKKWIGTRDEYLAIPVKDPNTIYSITA